MNGYLKVWAVVPSIKNGRLIFHQLDILPKLVKDNFYFKVLQKFYSVLFLYF